MSKIFLRTGAWYQAETPHLSEDLELSSLLKNPVATPKETVVSCNCKSQIAALNERIDILTASINAPKETKLTEPIVEKTVAPKKAVPKKK